MENLFNNLFKEFFDSISELKNLDGFDIKAEETPNGITITAIQKPLKKDDNKKLLEYIDAFKKYVQGTEDFIFDEACDRFVTLSPYTIEDFQIMCDNAKVEDTENIVNSVELFKNCIKGAVTDFIVELQDKYELDK